MAENYSFVDPKTGAIWQKVLFHRPRTFPDNFTPDECFLAAIKRNQNLHKYTLQQCFLGATQVSFIIIFKMSSYFLVYLHTYLLQCWTVGAIFTFGRRPQPKPQDKKRQTYVKKVLISNHSNQIGEFYKNLIKKGVCLNFDHNPH